MKILFRIFAAALFIVFFLFALKNTQEASLLLFSDHEIFRGPLVLLLLAFFAVGAILGVFATMPTMFRHRRELAKQKKLIAKLEKEIQIQERARTQPPLPDSIVGN